MLAELKCPLCSKFVPAFHTNKYMGMYSNHDGPLTLAGKKVLIDMAHHLQALQPYLSRQDWNRVSWATLVQTKYASRIRFSTYPGGRSIYLVGQFIIWQKPEWNSRTWQIGRWGKGERATKPSQMLPALCDTYQTHWCSNTYSPHMHPFL